MQKLEEMKKKLIDLQEIIDTYEVKAAEGSLQQYDDLQQKLHDIEKDIKSLSSHPESTAISYRLLLQEHKSQLNQLSQRLTVLQPSLDIPRHQPLSMDALYDAYLKAVRFHLKDDSYSLDKEQFLNAVKAARVKARTYYEGKKTQAAIGIDEKGPYIEITKRKEVA